MTDRKALAAAYESYVRTFGFGPISQALRERLAQLPEKCGTCGGSGFEPDTHTARGTPFICPTCHGSGKVYPAELVKKVALAAFAAWYKDEVYTPGFGQEQSYERIAIAVLDALNGEAE